MMSCQTTDKVVYVVPEIEFPDYPNPSGKTEYMNEGVWMTLSHYEEIMKYKLKVDEAKKIYSAAREIYCGENSREE